MPQIFWILLTIIVVGLVIYSAKKRNKKENNIDELPSLTKEQKDFFRGKPFDNECRNWYDDIKENKN
jgi:hypothetical protein